MPTYASITEHDRVIASERMIPIGARPQIDPNLENPEFTPADPPDIPTPDPITGWVVEDISKFSIDKSFDLNEIDSNVSSMTFNSDGTKLFAIGSTNDVILEYDLSVAYSFENVSYVTSYDIITGATSIFMDNTGTNMFIGRSVSDCGSIWKYSLTTPWDISTKTVDEKFSEHICTIKGITGIFFSENGFYMNISDSDTIYSYELSYPWVLDTAEMTSSYVPNEITTNISGFVICPDGTKLYVMQANSSKIFQYSLSSEYDVSSAVYDELELDIVEDSVAKGLYVYDEETLYFIGISTDKAYQYIIVKYWEFDNLVRVNTDETLEGPSPSYACSGFKISPDESTLLLQTYQTGTARVYQYNMPVPGVYQNFELVNSSGLTFSSSIFTCDDSGTKFFTKATTSGLIREFTMSTPWDITTESSTGSSTPLSENITTMFVNADSSKLFVGYSGINEIREYELTTPGSISTITPTGKILDVTTIGDISSYILDFVINADGTQGIIRKVSDSFFYEIRMSTPWDITTATATGETFSYPDNPNPSHVQLMPDNITHITNYNEGSYPDGGYMRVYKNNG